MKLRKPYLVKEVGKWMFTFHYKQGSIDKTFLSITSEGGLMNMRIGGNTDTFGYLLAAAMQDRVDQLEGYALTLFCPAMAITQDAELNDDIQKAIVRYFDRKEKQAAEEAAKVTDEQETANQAVMEDVAEYADAKTDKERKVIREQWKEETKQILTADEGETERIQGD